MGINLFIKYLYVSYLELALVVSINLIIIIIIIIISLWCHFNLPWIVSALLLFLLFFSFILYMLYVCVDLSNGMSSIACTCACVFGLLIAFTCLFLVLNEKKQEKRTILFAAWVRCIRKRERERELWWRM
jgi:hypothetical protein